MSRGSVIALIIIAVLTVAAGVYWYLEFLPLSDIGSKTTVEKGAEAPSPEQATVQREIEVEEALPVQPRPPAELEASAEPLLPAMVVPAEALVVEAPATEEQVVESPTVELPVAEVPMVEPLLEAEAPMAEEEPVDIQAIAAEIPYDEVEVTIIPFTELEGIFGSDLFALAAPLPIDLSLLEIKPTPPEVELPAPIVAEQPAQGSQAEELVTPIEVEETTPRPVEGEQPPQISEDEQLPTPLSSEPVGIDDSTLDIEETVVATESDVIPTARVERERTESKWETEARISLVHLPFPALKAGGFNAELGVLHRQSDLFSWGGGVAIGKKGGDVNLDLVASVRWTFKSESKLSYPLTLSLGPSMLFSAKPDFGLVARAVGGIRYEIIDRLALFFDVGLSGYWHYSNGFSFALEPARIGISFSF